MANFKNFPQSNFFFDNNFLQLSFFGKLFLPLCSPIVDSTFCIPRASPASLFTNFFLNFPKRLKFLNNGITFLYLNQFENFLWQSCRARRDLTDWYGDTRFIHKFCPKNQKSVFKRESLEKYSSSHNVRARSGWVYFLKGIYFKTPLFLTHETFF